eukprot:CAMPEP_0179090484 /NCGR_PEP_ID=MMETSP0796-20121207/41284_1 /TAXON_ID=73915 /ORGANISM="Pyrodinium bahamense, Strain pbaha01" /LENGTH=151 /DNA_ID=CAMNT_0020788057 /DNA_START=12 /DNA_END=468 /DNA_ORIENTATION=-
MTYPTRSACAATFEASTDGGKGSRAASVRPEARGLPGTNTRHRPEGEEAATSRAQRWPVERLVDHDRLPGFDEVLLRLQDTLRRDGIPEADKGNPFAPIWDVNIVKLAKLLEVKLQVDLRHVGRDTRHEEAPGHGHACRVCEAAGNRGGGR